MRVNIQSSFHHIRFEEVHVSCPCSRVRCMKMVWPYLVERCDGRRWRHRRPPHQNIYGCYYILTRIIKLMQSERTHFVFNFENFLYLTDNIILTHSHRHTYGRTYVETMKKAEKVKPRKGFQLMIFQLKWQENISTKNFSRIASNKSLRNGKTIYANYVRWI